jgi:glycosyltransferase involved in cell wall biosynthesis
MDRDMSPRVAYWCSSFDADMEAIASEVALLRRAFPGSITWGIAARDWLRLSPRSGFGVHPRLHGLFRMATWAAQRCYDVQHLFGGLGDWFHLRAVSRKPVVLTMAVEGPPCDAALLSKVDRFVTEWPCDDSELTRLGIDRERVRTILPPVDLERFSPAAAAPGRFSILFASSPERADWLTARGVDLILDAAELCPDFRFSLVWRPWGESLKTVEAWIAQRRLSNVELTVGRMADMAQFYLRSHVTVAPFVDIRRCKPVPNSVVESMACGRPVVVTPAVRLASMIAKSQAGRVALPTGAGLAESFREIEADWGKCSTAARELAEQRFSKAAFIAAYRELYREVS